MPKSINIDNMSRSEWLDLRRGSIGGSEISAIMYCNDFKSPLDVYLDKIGKGASIVDKPQMEFGRRAEEMVSQWFSDETGLTVRKFHQMFVDDKQPYRHANPDRQIVASGPETETGILEVKTTSQYYIDTWQYEIALPWYLQLQHYLSIKGYSYGYICWLVRNDGSLHWKRFEADKEVIQNIREACHKFWTEHVEKRVPPADTAEKQELINLLSKPIAGKTTEIDGEMFEIYKEYYQTRQARLDAKKDEERLKASLELYTGSAERLVYDGELVATFLEHSPERFNQSAFAEEHPDLYEEFKEKMPYRKFTPKLKLSQQP